MIKLHLGCGTVHLDDYINVDLRNYKGVADVVASCDALPYEKETVDEIISFHLFEHFDEEKAKDLLKYWYNLLKFDGKLIIECPNILNLCKRMLEVYEKDGNLRPGYIFGAHSRIGRESIPNDVHQWGYTPESLSKYLVDAGFSIISTGDGTDYHAQQSGPGMTVRVEAKKEKLQ